MADRTIKDIIRLSPEEKKAYYQSSNTLTKSIDIVTIDNETFTCFSAFSFLMEKTYVKSPTRSGDGSISNLDSYAWFLTPHLKIDFSLLSIDSYRSLMRLIQSKNEFVVTCYDPVQDKNVRHNMYFATEQMPKLWSIAKALNGESWVELLGVQDYTVELIGTNTNVDEFTITYNINVPQDATWSGDSIYTTTTPSHLTHFINAYFQNGDERINALDITFNDLYKFKYWCEDANGVGFKYVNGNEYLMRNNTNLYAIWEKGGA